MPISGQGIVPAAGAQYNELTYAIRRAIAPRMVVQLYNSTPTLWALLGNSQIARGGVSSVTVPVQGSQFVTGQWSSYDGTFSQPAVQPAVTNAEYNLKLFIVPIPFLGTEALLQDGHAIVNLIDARMNDSTNTAMDVISTSLWNNGLTGIDNTQITGMPMAIDDGTNMVTYAGINRTTNTFWKSKVYAAGSVNPTRSLINQYITGTVKNGAEMPTFGVCGPGVWANLANDFIGQENYVVTPDAAFDSDPNGPRSSFRALMVAGVPIFMDPYLPETTTGNLYFINSNYLNLYVHQMAKFAFTGFESTLSNFQVGYVGAVVTALEMVLVKPKACTRIGGFNALSL